MEKASREVAQISVFSLFVGCSNGVVYYTVSCVLLLPCTHEHFVDLKPLIFPVLFEIVVIVSRIPSPPNLPG